MPYENMREQVVQVGLAGFGLGVVATLLLVAAVYIWRRGT